MKFENLDRRVAPQEAKIRWPRKKKTMLENDEDRNLL
jgi:hypothetical protein